MHRTYSVDLISAMLVSDHQINQKSTDMASIIDIALGDDQAQFAQPRRERSFSGEHFVLLLRCI